jgi:hypothetical protein
MRFHILSQSNHIVGPADGETTRPALCPIVIMVAEQSLPRSNDDLIDSDAGIYGDVLVFVESRS